MNPEPIEAVAVLKDGKLDGDFVYARGADYAKKLAEMFGEPVYLVTVTPVGILAVPK